MTIQTFLVGGAVRDLMLGQKPKDMDYTVVAPSFDDMRTHLLEQGYKIFVEKEEFATIRAIKDKKVADYVLARKEGPYTDGRHPDWVTVGTLEDDLRRRDLTINAMAMDENGKIIDLFGGKATENTGGTLLLVRPLRPCPERTCVGFVRRGPYYTTKPVRWLCLAPFHICRYQIPSSSRLSEEGI